MQFRDSLSIRKNENKKEGFGLPPNANFKDKKCSIEILGGKYDFFWCRQFISERLGQPGTESFGHISCVQQQVSKCLIDFVKAHLIIPYKI